MATSAASCDLIMHNHTLNQHDNETLVILDTYKAVAGGLSFLLTLPFVLFHFKFFPIGSTSAVLLGAFLMVITLTVGQRDVYHVLGSVDNLRTIFLLLGMMLLAQYFERELLIEKLMEKFLKKNVSFLRYLMAVTCVDFLVAAIFTNDVACVVLTPLILKHWQMSKRPRHELSTLLLGIATSANIGSSTTVFGNPQMALIASKTSESEFRLSQLDMRRCVYFLWLPAAVCFVANFFFLMIHYKIRSKYRRKENKSNNITIVPYSGEPDDKIPDIYLLSFSNPADSFVENNNHDVLRNCENSQNVVANRKISTLSATIGFDRVERSTSIGSMAFQHEEKENSQLIDPEFLPTNSWPFLGILFFNVALIVALFLASNEKVQFDTGLVPIGAAVIIICSDALINKRASLAVMKRVDWSVLMMFFGIFVWLHGLNSTKIPLLVWQKAGLARHGGLQTGGIADYAIFFGFIVFGSNVFSNVPLTIIVLELLAPCVNQLDMVLYLAWLATIAGNLTLFGSVANLIVAQKSWLTIQYRFGFFEYLEFGLITTLILSVLGMIIIFGLLMVF